MEWSFRAADAGRVVQMQSLAQRLGNWVKAKMIVTPHMYQKIARLARESILAGLALWRYEEGKKGYALRP